MALRKKKTKKELELEVKITNLQKDFENLGYTVRREKLSRGSAFRVKSGGCLLTNQKVIFLDKRLPLEQQYGVLSEYAESTKSL